MNLLSFLFWVFFCCFLVLNQCHDGVEHSKEEIDPLETTYDNCILLDPEHEFKLYWNIVENGTRVRFALNLVESGWQAIGISTDGYMGSNGEGSDINMMWNNDGTCRDGCIGDYWATEHEQPEQDSSFDVEFINYEISEGKSTFVYERPLISSDPQDRSFSTTGGTNLIWAIGEDSPSSAIKWKMHIARGVKRINIFGSYTCEKQMHNMHMDHSGHQMYFSAGNDVTILFKGWNTNNPVEYFFSFLALVVLAALYEAFFIMSPIFIRNLGRNSNDMDGKRFTNKQRILSTLSRMAQLAVAYLLMLAVMTYDVGLFFAVVIGFGLGHIIFFPQYWRSSQFEEKDVSGCH